MPDPEKGSLPQRLYLLAAAFAAGAAIMIVELAGNRLLAPWFGSGLYTWTGLIGVILVSISVGYYAGGHIADRWPRPLVLSHLLALSALLTLLVPLAEHRVLARLARLDLVSGPLLASLLLFGVPGCLLGAVTPFCIRLTSLLSGDRKIGVSAGTIGMLSTLASVIGTFLSGFVLIPRLDLRHIFLGVGLILGLLAVAGYALHLRRRGAAALLALALALAAWPSLGERRLPRGVLFNQTTFYHRVIVGETTTAGGRRTRQLYLDGLTHGGEIVGSDAHLYPYSRYWELLRLLEPAPDRVLVLGGGAYTMPKAILDGFPRARVDVVEIDPVVIRVGQDYFGTRRYPRLRSVAEDARRFVSTAATRYDAIVGDVYLGATIPAHLVTREFFDQVAGRLSPRGLYLMNVIGAAKGPGARLFNAIVRTLRASFAEVQAFATEPDRLEGEANIMLLASAKPLDTRRADLPPSVGQLLRTRIDLDRRGVAAAPLLTDLENPAELIASRRVAAQRE